jgi:steroid delta-isomerase-like uncharacterized protein
MSAEENVAVVRRVYEEVFDKHNVAIVVELYADDFVYHSPGWADLDREGLKRGLAAYLAAFPDAQMIVEDVFGGGDRVASRFTCRGTHRGEYAGVPPTGKQITMTAILTQRFAGGKIAEDWEWSDRLGFMQQLGAIPAVSATV